jgi:hypothetical protein
MIDYSGEKVSKIFDYIQRAKCQTAVSSTALGLYVRISCVKQEYIGNLPTDEMKQQIAAIVVKYPSVVCGDFVLLNNPVRERIKDAIEILKDQTANRTIFDLSKSNEKIVNTMGEALDLQISRDRRFFDQIQSGKRDIISRLKILNAPSELITNYSRLHIFYLSTKHQDNSDLIRARGELSGRTGREKATEYFNSVKNLLIWYFKSINAPIPEEFL